MILDISIYCISFWAFVESRRLQGTAGEPVAGTALVNRHCILDKLFGFTRKWMQASRLQLFATPNFKLPFLLADSSFVL
ncbi:MULTISPECIES: hypothetical protein [unclassified Microcoleus]|uniref:hypothetical protein n=1 Tax=unclassified Microcoleus TaxID=2642155 RepID=UPI002FCFF526